jgi:predicted DNA-binding transcriptional regulator YafY
MRIKLLKHLHQRVHCSVNHAIFADVRSISFELYRDRFGASLRTFRRDLTALRDAGIYLEWHPTRGYKLLYFRGGRGGPVDLRP